MKKNKHSVYRYLSVAQAWRNSRSSSPGLVASVPGQPPHKLGQRALPTNCSHRPKRKLYALFTKKPAKNKQTNKKNVTLAQARARVGHKSVDLAPGAAACSLLLY